MNRLIKPILRAGLVVGTLDILAAMLHYYLNTHRNPVAVLQFVASGAFGANAFSGAWHMVLWGVLFHYVIAFAFTIFFFFVYFQVPSIRKLGLSVAFIYGGMMWATTQFIVIPLSRIDKTAPLTVINTTVSILVLVVCIGIPLYYMAKKAYHTTR